MRLFHKYLKVPRSHFKMVVNVKTTPVEFPHFILLIFLHVTVNYSIHNILQCKKQMYVIKP